MRLPQPLVAGRLLRRYKRFLADVVLDASGETVTAHCANSGSMMGLARPGARVLLWRSPDPKRKLAWSWILEDVDGAWVCIDTGLPNAVVAEAIAQGAIPTLAGWATLRREVAYGVNSRVDLLLKDPIRGRAWVEVKNVTLSRVPGVAEFPDARTTRGAKHLVELSARVAAGDRAVMVYLVDRSDCARFRLAADIDPAYALAFAAARAAGVEAIAWATRITEETIVVEREIPIDGLG
ncbi:DNA/RNA nuclease SfsA [Siculibacillus lacustris]|uniref:Sugar fermentation stimulation protein homolog n=1 Tax=Siculibacillus lacustris TaxID=1549641 RepID=A0A4Q9VQW4_9HYPH|nr:DNA/RNA nuclease SfsA [Siculibacillus lacustris]TBW38239.1 DNA/RNA nuclease SfsA [Siculibacillus lacustris]